MPVFPDKYAPQFKGLSSFTLEYDPENDSEFDQKILLDGLVSDADNIDANIHVSAETDAALSAVCDITAKGLELTFKAKGQGNGSLTLLAESNGRVSSINIRLLSNPTLRELAMPKWPQAASLSATIKLISMVWTDTNSLFTHWTDVR